MVPPELLKLVGKGEAAPACSRGSSGRLRYAARNSFLRGGRGRVSVVPGGQASSGLPPRRSSEGAAGPPGVGTPHVPVASSQPRMSLRPAANKRVVLQRPGTVLQAAGALLRGHLAVALRKRRFMRKLGIALQLKRAPLGTWERPGLSETVLDPKQAASFAQLRPTFLDFLGAFVIALLAEPGGNGGLHTRRSRTLREGEDFITPTPETQGAFERQATYLRVKGENKSFRLAKTLPGPTLPAFRSSTMPGMPRGPSIVTVSNWVGLSGVLTPPDPRTSLKGCRISST